MVMTINVDCERKLNTPAKTGLPGSVLPKNYKPFVCFSIDVFNYLAQLGFTRLGKIESGSSMLAVESFPLSARKSLGLRPLKACWAVKSSISYKAAMLRNVRLLTSNPCNSNKIFKLSGCAH